MYIFFEVMTCTCFSKRDNTISGNWKKIWIQKLRVHWNIYFWQENKPRVIIFPYKDIDYNINQWTQEGYIKLTISLILHMKKNNNDQKMIKQQWNKMKLFTTQQHSTIKNLLSIKHTLQPLWILYKIMEFKKRSEVKYIKSLRLICEAVTLWGF